MEPESIRDIIGNSETIDEGSISDLAGRAAARKFTGIAWFSRDRKEACILFLEGNPAGAVYTDDQGTLYGDKAMLRFGSGQVFRLHALDPARVESLARISRIYQPLGVLKETSSLVPEIGKKAAGMGTLVIQLRKDGAPRQGLRVSIRRSGKMIGSDHTLGDGTVSFRAEFGEYDCVVQLPSQELRTFRIPFSRALPRFVLDL